MIPSTRLTRIEFAQRFPPGGKPNPSPPNAPSKARKKDDSSTEIPNHAILNDVPTVSTSCLVYNYDELQKHAGDSTYPVPSAEHFPNLRQLESQQAVFKRINDGKCVFLHMLLSPEDVLKVFGQEFRDELLSIQRDVCPIFNQLIADHWQGTVPKAFREILRFEGKPRRSFQLHGGWHSANETQYPLASGSQYRKKVNE
jgi:hypothetical protein